MYARSITPPDNTSFFLFGPRGTGKSSWVKHYFQDACYIDLLESRTYLQLLADPSRLEGFILNKEWVIIDEVQKIPALLDEVHRLIESQKRKFVLTGSSARKLKRSGANLLAGRAVTRYLYPLTVTEVAKDFSLKTALQNGTLPPTFATEEPADFLSSYVRTYLKEEIEQEGLTRNIGAFSRFLEQISFSQACVLNISEVAKECAVNRKTVEDYIVVLEDLLLAYRLPVFSKRAKRELTVHPKFFFFDTGVFRTIRPRGPLDRPEEIDGAALKTTVFQQLLALNDYRNFGFHFFHWRTKGQIEVDLVLYGERGIKAFEVKRASRYRSQDLAGLKAFKQDYPMADAFLLYGGDKELLVDGVRIIPLEQAMLELEQYLV